MSEEIDPYLLTRFKVVKKMGSGAYGHVFKVIDREDNKTKALKKNFDAFTNSTDAQRTYREIMFLLQLKHPNIVGLEDVFKAKNGKDIYILFEYMEADLFEVTRAKHILTDRHRKYILYQVAKALLYLHSSGIVHRDLKPSNILVNEQCEAKICDFGLVRSVDDLDDEDERMTEYIATRWYRAPEILLGSRNYSKSVDVWSFGCLIAEVFTGKALFPGNSTLNQIERVLKWTGVPSMADLKCLKTQFGKHLLELISTIKPLNKKEVVGSMDPMCLDLLEKTLTFNPDRRITIKEVLTHPYFSEHFNPQDLVESKRKVKVPIKDSMKLGLKEYRSLIYQEISKNNIKQKDFSISRIRCRSLKTEEAEFRNTSKASKSMHRSISNESGERKSIKTIKKTEVVFKKRKHFDQPWDHIQSRAPSRAEENTSKTKNTRPVEFMRKGQHYKAMKAGLTKPKLWVSNLGPQKLQSKSMPLK